jgi:hypothetical protein
MHSYAAKPDNNGVPKYLDILLFYKGFDFLQIAQYTTHANFSLSQIDYNVGIKTTQAPPSKSNVRLQAVTI